MGREVRRYAVVIEHDAGQGWIRLVEPWSQFWDSGPVETAVQVSENFDLAELGHPWAVGVFEGARFDHQLADLRG
jgi:hypothetical protein